MTTTLDPWEQLHGKIAPMLISEAEFLARKDPGFDPVCFIFDSDEARQEPFRSLLEVMDTQGRYQPGHSVSITLPRPLAVRLLKLIGAPPTWQDDAAAASPVLPVFTCTQGELRLRHETYAAPR